MARKEKEAPAKAKRKDDKKSKKEAAVETKPKRKSKKDAAPDLTKAQLKRLEKQELIAKEAKLAAKKYAIKGGKNIVDDSTGYKPLKVNGKAVVVPPKNKKGVEEIKKAFFNPMAGIDDVLDGIEKDYGLSGATLGAAEDRLTTGTLALDVILGGGLVPGWYTFFGGEQSCKSTGASWLMISALFSEVPVISMWDFEGSSSSEYIENMMEVNGIDMPIEQVFGIRDAKTAKWAVQPRVRYYSEGIAEKFFDYLAKLERMLPDKLKMNDKWYYVYEGKTPEGKIHKANATRVGKHYDVKYFQKTGKYRIEAPDGNLQALVIVDSYPAMLSEKQDVDDPGSAMAMQARMFSEQLKRVKGRMRSKRICVVGVNQLRKAPMVAYGNPEYEPCGESLKFYSDVRLRMQPRVLNSAPGMTKSDKGMILEEKSVLGGVDKYRMIHVRAHKNKLSVPNMDGWLRLWIEDANGAARGFDPVWDTWRYLVETGQATGKRNNIKLEIKGKDCKKVLSWMDFKRLILGTRKEMKEIYDRIGMKPMDLRAWCKKDLAVGDGLSKIFEVKKAGLKEEKEEAVKVVASSDDDEE